MNRYIGHASQLYGIEEHRLIGGKGDGMWLFEVHNGKGWVSEIMSLGLSVETAILTDGIK